MALKKLNVPGVNPGSVDKLYGEDWNRLVDALTGNVAENITLTGLFKVSRPNADLAEFVDTSVGVKLKVRPITSGTRWMSFDIDVDGGGYVTDVLQLREQEVRINQQCNILANVESVFSAKRTSTGAVGYELGSNDATGGNVYIDLHTDSGDGDYRSRIIRNNGANGTFDLQQTGTGAIRLIGANVNVDSGKQLFLDGGGDTYLSEVAANQLRATAGGAEVWTAVQTALNVVQDLKLAAAKRLYLDGGGDTYIYESSANVLDFLAGNILAMRLTNVSASFGQALTIQNDQADLIRAYRPNNTPTTGSGIRFDLNDSAGNQEAYALIYGIIVTNTNGAEDGKLSFRTKKAGTMKNWMELLQDGTFRIYEDAGIKSVSLRHDGNNAILAVSSGDLVLQPGANVSIPSTKKLYLDGGGDTFIHEASANMLDIVSGGSVGISLRGTGQVWLRAGSGAADPTASDINAGYGMWWKNTTANEVRLWYNDGGTMKKSAALA
ncbi:hypothetical protein [Nitrososphaera viennensis]|uniref:Uncharacterized protein n=2 Tax=Nitrososphaera viennensis TaxID=1034015 RepID=A0A060HPB2_9ARCH|nr:hypothetical protein [Nitrososphaera viennensis]AIC16960.1 hypothetical protein NVIE_026880 [Nitrososphaera viennensis EN76]UVS68863.1 hypothetical protein NWT39_13260 [Nitrososphaera viennensis]CBX88970.1 hypothetical protein [Nitrososphaera phage Pro-Nvie1]